MLKIKKNELETLIKTVRIYGQEVEVKFGIEKCSMQMRSGKRHLTEGTELPNQEKIRMLEEKETYKYLGILEVETIKKMAMKEKI